MLRGHTPTMLRKTSASDGIDSSPVTTAQRRPQGDPVAMLRSLGLSDDELQHEKRIESRKADKDTYRGHLLRSVSSKIGYSACWRPYTLSK